LRRATEALLDIPQPDLAKVTPQETILSKKRHEVLKLVFESRTAELRAESEMAYKLMAGFVTLELGLATWLAAHPPDTPSGAWGIYLLNLLLGGFIGSFIWRNYGRRHEIITTIQNVARVWELTVPGVYLEDRPLYAEPYRYSWRTPYLVLIFFFCVAQAIPVFQLL
jgi:hypothetical protein